MQRNRTVVESLDVYLKLWLYITHINKNVRQEEANTIPQNSLNFGTSSRMAPPATIPKLEELPLNAGDPPNSAWGLWGPGDKLGSLNYLTGEVVLKTIQEEVKTGDRVGLE